MRNSLGKGLDALFTDNSSDDNAEKDVTSVKIRDIEPNKEQPRRNFDDDKIDELCSSIKKHGIISPIIVREIGNDRYQIVAGERRWRAARRAGISEVPVVIRKYSDREVKEIALIENLQRQDLNAVEEANGYKSLMNDYDLTQEQIAEIVAKSRPQVANALRLLNLPQEVLVLLEGKKISSGHARALLSLSSKEKMIEIAHLIIKNNLSVRDVEKISSKKEVTTKKEQASNYLYEDMAKQISEKFGRKININAGKNKGKIEIEYYSDEDLDNLVSILLKNKE